MMAPERRFSKLLSGAGYTPNEYARITGFDRRNVKNWLFDDNAIPEAIRSIILCSLDLSYTETLNGLIGPDPFSRRHNLLFRLIHKTKTITQMMIRRNGEPYLPSPFKNNPPVFMEDIESHITILIGKGFFDTML